MKDKVKAILAAVYGMSSILFLLYLVYNMIFS